MKIRTFLRASALAAMLGSPLYSQAPIRPFAVPAANQSYADIADLVVNSSLIVDARISKTTNVPAEQAPGVPASRQRMLVEAQVLALVRGEGGVSGNVRFLLDLPKDANGKLPKIKKQRYFLLGSKVAGPAGTIKLSRPDALVEWSANNDAMLRAITKEAVARDAPLAFNEFSGAIFSSGALAGEGDSQIFANSSGRQIYAISVNSRQGRPKSWSVSTGDLIDQNASAPKRNTLIWYRLACGLPPKLDENVIENSEPADIARLNEDYRFVLDALGRCDRTRR